MLSCWWGEERKGFYCGELEPAHNCMPVSCHGNLAPNSFWGFFWFCFCFFLPVLGFITFGKRYFKQGRAWTEEDHVFLLTLSIKAKEAVSGVSEQHESWGALATPWVPPKRCPGLTFNLLSLRWGREWSSHIGGSAKGGTGGFSWEWFEGSWKPVCSKASLTLGQHWKPLSWQDTALDGWQRALARS